MPTVPTAGNPKVAPAGMPNASFVTPQANAPDVQLRPNLLSTPQVAEQRIDTPTLKYAAADPNAIQHINLGDGGAQQTEQLGRSIGAVGDAMSRQVLDYQRTVNATVVDDALDQARQAALHLTYGQDDGHGNVVGGYTQLKGEAAFRRPAGNDGKPVSLDAEVSKAFDDQVSAIRSAKLSNPDQQAVFNAQLGGIRDQLVGGALSHSDTEFQAYRNSVYSNGVKNDAAAFALISPVDAKGQADALTQLDQKVATFGILNHAAPEEIQQQQFLARTNAVSGMLDTAIAGKNYTQASAVLNTYADKIDPNTAAKYRMQLSGHAALQVGEQLADAAFKQQGAPAYASGDADRGWNINHALESGQKQAGPDGKLLVSKAGAFGSSQLEPDTAVTYAAKIGHPEYAHYVPAGTPGAVKAAGGKWVAGTATQTDAAGQQANIAVGKAVWGALVGKFGGDVTKASAAYNAGPGYLVGGTAPDGTKLEGALPWAARTGGDWRSYPGFKPETTQRINNVQTAMKLGDGKPAKPSKSALYASIDAQTTDPDARQAGYARVDKLMAAADYDERQGYDDAFSEGVRVITAANGDVNAIDPRLRAQIKPEDFEKLQTYGRNTADGTYRTTDDATYYAVMNPTAIRAMSPADVQRAQLKLSKRDGDQLQSLWQDYHSPAPDKGPTSLDLSLVDGIAENHLAALGINTHPKSKDPDGTARIGAIKGAIHRAVLDVQAQTGQKISDYDAMDKVVGQLFLKNQAFRTGLLGRTHGSQSVLASDYKDIPVDLRGKIEDQLRYGPLNQQGQRVGRGLGRNPTHGEVLEAYFRNQNWTQGFGFKGQQ